MTTRLKALAQRVIAASQARGLSLVTAESCTAGKLSTLLSEVPGAGEHLHGGFVTYTKSAKSRLLGVPESLLRQKGAVCADVAVAMARGALERSPASLAAAITGVAGPVTDKDHNPVGFVWIAVVLKGKPPAVSQRHYGDIGRTRILETAVADTLGEVLRLIEATESTGTQPLRGAF